MFYGYCVPKLLVKLEYGAGYLNVILKVYR